MKDNLIQKLDLLESQLFYVESNGEAEPTGKLARTKHLLKRKAHDEETPTVDELRSQIKEVKQEVVQRKFYHTHVIIKRFLKQFKKVEQLRIAKRLKTAETEAKQANLAAEAELVKDADVDMWSEEIVNRAVLKHHDLAIVAGINFEKRALAPTEINVFARIGKTKVVQEAITQLLQHISTYFESSQESINKKTEGSEKKDKTDKTDKTEKKKERKEEKKEKEKEKEKKKETTEEQTEEQTEDGPELDTFFEQPVVAPHIDDISDEDENESNLPMLAQGYISGSDDDEDVSIPAPQPERRNRRGQRARRLIWEQKYGQKANHIIKESREKQREQEEKENRKRRKEERERAAKRQKLELAEKPVHPSWEAHQQQKKKLETAKFAGVKVKFD